MSKQQKEPSIVRHTTDYMFVLSSEEVAVLGSKNSTTKLSPKSRPRKRIKKSSVKKESKEGEV